MSRDLRADAEAIFRAGVAAVEPGKLVREAVAKLPPEVLAAITAAPRIHVAGGGKACAGMAAGLETALAPITSTNSSARSTSPPAAAPT